MHGDPTTSVTVRIPRRLFAALDEEAVRVRELTGITPTRTQVLVALLEEALTARGRPPAKS